MLFLNVHRVTANKRDVGPLDKRKECLCWSLYIKPRVDVGGIEVHMNIQLFARLYTTVNRNIERGHQASGYVDFLSQSVLISTVM